MLCPRDTCCAVRLTPLTIILRPVLSDPRPIVIFGHLAVKYVVNELLVGLTPVRLTIFPQQCGAGLHLAQQFERPAGAPDYAEQIGGEFSERINESFARLSLANVLLRL